MASVISHDMVTTICYVNMTSIVGDIHGNYFMVYTYGLYHWLFTKDQYHMVYTWTVPSAI